MPSDLLVDALGVVVRIDMKEMTDADAAAIRDAWAGAVVAEPRDRVSSRSLRSLAQRPESPAPGVAERGAQRRDEASAAESVAERGAQRRDEASGAVPVAEPSPPIIAPAATGDLRTLLADLSQRVTLAAIDARAGQVWMLHAAGIAAADGRVVALIGPSGRGKTTAARTLGIRFGYVSDETVAVDDDGRVWPYRKPLSVIEGSGPKTQRSPVELGLQPLPDAPLSLAAIVLLERSDDAPAEPVVEDVDFGEALADLVAQCSYLTAMPAPLHAMAAHAASVGGIRRVTYREAKTLPAVVEALLAGTTDRVSSRSLRSLAQRPELPPQPVVERISTRRSALTRLPLPRDETSPQPVVERISIRRSALTRLPLPRDETPTTPRYSRAPVVDALPLADPERIALLRAGDEGTGTVNVLAGVAPALWRAADAASVDDLIAAALAAYGEPPGSDAAALVTTAIDELVEAGVLVEHRASWRVRDDVAWTDNDDRVVALALSDPAASPLALEGSAAVIWRVMAAESPASAEHIVATVAAEVGADEASVGSDVREFLASLRDAALVDFA